VKQTRRGGKEGGMHNAGVSLILIGS